MKRSKPVAVLLTLSLSASLTAFAAETPVPPEAGVIAPGPGLVLELKGGNKLVAWGDTLEVSETDAFLQSGGMCAFNLGYYVQSYSGANDVTNTITDGDRLAAKQTHVSLAAGAKQYILTQPYLVPGMNKLSLLVNAEGGNTDAKTAYVNVRGTCGKVDGAATTSATSSSSTTSTTATGATSTGSSTTKPTTPATTTDKPASTTTSTTSTTSSATGNCVGTISATLGLKAPCLQYSGPFGSETYWVELERVITPGSQEILYRLKNYGAVK
ncbi:MAG: hypothetical protein KGZ83_21295 [Sulfuricella sp.]|nr:hypothetical protein [Sulfuricella sp.]